MENNTVTTVANFTVGNFTVHSTRNLITRDTAEISITPKMLSVLTELANHQGKTLSKEHLILAVWGSLHTSDMVLSRAISDLRKVFGDSARKQDYIETVTKQGYRLKQAVSWQQTSTNSKADFTPGADGIFGANTSQQQHLAPVLKQSFDATLPPECVTKHTAETGVDEPGVAKAGVAITPKSLVRDHKTKNKLLSFTALILILMLLLLLLLFSDDIFLTNKVENPAVAFDLDPKYTTLTNDENTERYIRFSPDGKSLAYVVNSEDKPGSEIHLHSLIDNNIVTVNALANSANTATANRSAKAVLQSKTPSYDAAPAFSPDGKAIAYKHFSKAGCFIHIFNFTTAPEQELEQEQEQIRELAECPYSKTQALDWSPDGKYLVTTVFNHIKKIESLALIQSLSGKITTLPAPKHKASGYLWPRFSPDGNNIAVVYYRPNSNLWTLGLVDTGSGVFTEILASGKEISQVVWNESGDSLYYLIVRNSDAGIWQVNLTTKKSQLIVNANSSSLDFDEVTQQFAYIQREQKFSIWQSYQNKTGEVISAPLFKHLPQTNYPSLSADNKTLAFISTASGIDSLWIRALENNSNTLLFQSTKKEKLSAPRWSPDGKQLLISVLSKASSKMIQFDVELGNAELFPAQNNVKMGKWSSDGSKMYWYEEVDDIWQVIEKDLLSGQQSVILRQAVSRFEILDKNNLHYQKIGTVKVHSRQLANASSPQPTDKMLLSLKSSYTWDAHADVIYYLSYSRQNNAQMLFKMDLKTGNSEAIYAIDPMLTVNAGRHLSISKNASKAYYTRLDKYHTDIVLMTKRTNDQAY